MNGAVISIRQQKQHYKLYIFYDVALMWRVRKISFWKQPSYL